MVCHENISSNAYLTHKKVLSTKVRILSIPEFTPIQRVFLRLINKGCECMRTQLCPTLWDPMDCSPPGSSVHGIFQAIILEWVAISYSRGSSQPKDQTCISYMSCNGKQIINHWATWEASNWNPQEAMWSRNDETSLGVGDKGQLKILCWMGFYLPPNHHYFFSHREWGHATEVNAYFLYHLHN